MSEGPEQPINREERRHGKTELHLDPQRQSPQGCECGHADFDHYKPNESGRRMCVWRRDCGCQGYGEHMR